MHRPSERANRPTRTGTRAKRWSVIGALLALVFLLAACQTAPPEPAPQAEPEFDMELELALLDLPVNEQFRVRFLPPLAKRMPTGEFVDDLALEIRFFNVNPDTGAASGTTLGSTLSTSKRTIASRRGTFSTIWFSFNMLFERKATEYLRAEIRLPGGPNAPVCNETSEHCLGYLDIYMFKGFWFGRQNVPDGFVPVPALLGVLPISFKVLEEQAPPADNPPPATIGELQGVAGGSLGSDGQQALNCVSSYSGRPGQGLQRVGAGLQRVGAVGGLFQGQTADFPPTLVAPAVVGDELRSMIDDTVAPSWGSVLFVVDDFSAGLDLPAGLFEANADLDALAPDVSHGALVVHHVLQLVPHLLRFGNPTGGIGNSPDGDRYYWFQAAPSYGENPPSYFYIQTIDVGSETTDAIPDRIRDAIRHYDSKGVYDMVVNMSFAVVPCAVLNDYTNAQDLETFDDYLEALADVNGIGDGYLGELDELVSTPVNLESDPLLAYLACPFPSVLNGVSVCDGSGPVSGDWGPFSTLIHVAASGNYGNQYALFPAASPFVVSVGSLEHSATGYAPSGYSNLAEIAAPGGIFVLASVGDQTVGYAGTSFAAPAVSLFLAVDVMYSYNRCPYQDVQNGEPPALAHGDYDMTPFYVPRDPYDSAELVALCVVPR